MFDKNLDNFLNDKITDFSEISKNIWKKDITKGKNLDNLAWISLSVSSPEQIRALSYWKVLISETINYRTQRPERGWLFCEQIFGPRKNYECACGKYKRIRYKWIVCERCWVEVTKSSVRRERMAHIDLYAPVAHTWFLKSVPSRIWLLLDLPVKKLEQVVYFASYIITEVYDEKLKESQKNLEDTFKVSKSEMQKEIQKELNDIKIRKEAWEIKEKEFKALEAALVKKLDDLTLDFEELRAKLKMLNVWEVIWELDYRVLRDKFPHIFNWWTWAEYLKKLLEKIDLEQFIKDEQEELKRATQVKKKKILQKIKLASNLLKSGQRPEWFILEALPIIPPDLRPMIQLDGWRFASSDLNDLYRRVINRNNRLKKLIELGAPEVILKNEKRMLQEAVDMLITWETRTSRSGFVSANKKQLKSLTEILKGKQGRFRQNLLWKRVDYSGRSVIVVWPDLRMDECWLPKTMALTLFRPFVIWKLIQDWLTYTVKWAEKLIEEWGKEIWDALDEVIEGKYVLLNRAPTLHRLSIQAFKPVLIDWKAIRLHPLTCTAFNADFDWDQMAVHLPITEAAQKEARDLMVTSKNLLSPASWEPIVTPSQDMILWCYYLTQVNDEWAGTGQSFAWIVDLEQAYDAWAVDLRAVVRVRYEGKIIETTYGRLLFNQIVPKELWFVNEILKKWVIKRILSDSFEKLWSEITSEFVNNIKNFWYKYSTISGLSISVFDMVSPENKKVLLKEAEEKVKFIQKKHWLGFLTDDEKYLQSISIWADVKKVIENEMKWLFGKNNHIFNFIDSWARWNWWNLTQLCWMKWLVASTSWKTIELPIKSTLKEWFSTLEYFIATHGWRKWKSDTALKTAQSWYLTRRLVDAAQNIIVKEDDCHTIHYKEVVRENLSGFSDSFEDRIYWKTIANDIKDENNKIVINAWTTIDKKVIDLITKNSVNKVNIRSVLTCETEGWVCKKCYWLDLWLNKIVEDWTPVWVIAAQSIWEPWTQLTMRTFHSWWVAQVGWDMTQWLTRVEELFEARSPKNSALISDLDWTIEVIQNEKFNVVKITANELLEEEYLFPEDYNILVKDGQEIKEKQIIAKSTKDKGKVVWIKWWMVKKVEGWRIIVKDKDLRISEHEVEFGINIVVKSWAIVKRWQRLSEWHINLWRLMEVAWILKTQEYIVDEIKSIYASQWQTVNSKHIELIVRQMFSRVRILDKWDSEFFPWDIVDIIRYNTEKSRLIKDWKQAPIAERLLLWITKISLYTDSWLSAASFQETVRVLVEWSVSWKIDKLKELKENVIIWRLIPAWKQYRKINWVEIDEDYEEDIYFNVDDENVDISEEHMEKVIQSMEVDSDF
jgi:DNA-directed RNA polymerase subunit beta'